MSKNYTWDDEQLAYLVVARMKGDGWEQISQDMSKRFGISRSAPNIAGKYSKTIGVDLSNAFPPDQEQFIQDCWTNNFHTKQIIMGFKEQFGRTINENQIDMVVKQIQHEDSVEKELSKQTTKIKKEMNKMRKSVKWTKEEDDMIMSCNSRKEAFALQMNGRTKGAIRNRWQLLKPKSKKAKLKRGRYSVQEVALLVSCTSLEEALEAFKGKRSEYSITGKYNTLGNRTLQQRKPVKPVDNIKKPTKRGRMSKIELEMIRNCETVDEALALNLRKPETIIRQYATFHGNAMSKENREKSFVVLEAPKQKKKKKTHGNKGRKYTPRWTKEEDFELVCNFYELSIDEARNRFNRSYGAIASRLEMLVDSTKPDHISMLMEASLLIKARKQVLVKQPKKSRRTLRKERKKAKKEAKLKAKLMKLRGEKNGEE